MAAVTSILLGAAAGLSLANAYAQSEAIKTQGEFQKNQAETNARLADMDAQSAMDRGEQAQIQHGKKAAQLAGAQRVALAGQGIDLGSGSALELQNQTREMSAQDQMTIRNNAWREAWGYRSQSLQYNQSGQFAMMGAQSASRNTLLTGLGQAIDYGSRAYGKAPRGADKNYSNDV